MERAGLHAPVEQVLEMQRDVVGVDRRIDDRPLALGAVEGADQVEPEALLRVEQRDAGVRPGPDSARLGAHERRRRHDPAVEHHRVDAQVVAVDLPTPWLTAARLPEDRHEVRPFAERLVVARELGEELVDPHDRARLVVARVPKAWRRTMSSARSRTGWVRSSSMTPCRKWFMWTLIHVRHSVASIEKLARSRWPGVSACRNASTASSIGRVSTRGAARSRQPVRTTPSVVTPRCGRSSSAARSSTMLKISGAADSTWVRADIDCIGRMPNARHGSRAISSGVPIGVLTVRASRARSGLGGRSSASADSTSSISAGFVNTPECVSNRSPPHASRKTPPASPTIRLGPAKSHSDPNVRTAASSSPAATITASSTKLWLRGEAGIGNRRVTSSRQPTMKPSDGVTITLADASDVAVPTWIGSAAVASNDAPGETVRGPRPSAPDRPPATAERRRRHDADHDLAVDLEGDRRRPPWPPEGEVVRAVDAVEYPPPRRVAGLWADLLADHGVVWTLATEHVEHRLLGVEVDLRDRSAVRLVNRRQVLTREV